MEIKHIEDEHGELHSVAQGQLVLARDVECESIHGMTGQVYEIGTLMAGAWVKDHVRTVRADGSVVERFLASTDEGQTWYRQRAYEAIETRYL
jgi:hypothetical protein